jgi:enediyne biosynthesis thioesterase
LRIYEYRHRVGFEETSLVGSVYFAHFLRWQGRCREAFLAEHAPQVIAELSRGLSLATVRCSCDYFAELQASDEVSIRMRLAAVAQNRLTLSFEYWRATAATPAAGEELVARGEQQVAFMRRDGAALVPTPLPAALREALRPYASPEMLL